jgi:uncharacterized oxidoreductase
MPRFRVEDLRPLGVRILQAAGATEEEASLVVEHAIASLLSGEENHGLQLGTGYIENIRSGILKPGQPITIEKETPTTLLVNGNFNFGHYVSHKTMELLIEKARKSFVAAASIKYQCHVGRLADYTIMAADAGMIALMMTDGAWGTKFMAPWGGRERRLGVNPWSMAIPSDLDGTVVFDMTAGTVSFSKVIRAREQGESIPEGWIIDKDGRPTTDPNDFFNGGSELPMGGVVGHKGYALTFMIEALADILSGMEWQEDPSRPWPVIDGCFMALFNVEAFRPLAEFKRDMRDFARHVTSAAPAEGSPGVFYPGERSYLNAAHRAKEGVEIPGRAWERVLEYAREYGLEAFVPAPIGS